MKKKEFRYGSLFTYTSLQFCGNIEKYFAEHSRKFVAFIVMPRLKNKDNLIRLYEDGVLKKEEKVRLSGNIFMYYLLWYVTYLRIITTYFSRNEKLTVLAFHPISFFGMVLQRMVRTITFAMWIGDYFPPTTTGVRIYESVKKYYHDRVKYVCYLGDGINAKMNGRVVDTRNKKTVMWGVNPKNLKRTPTKNKFTILFVGVVKESQGLDHVFSFLRYNKDAAINIIGICDKVLYNRYQKLIKSYGITKQVYFPNRFFSDKEVDTIAAKCHVGIAMYDTDPNNPTFYTDPGKVKAYIEMGLPVIMSDVSAVAPFIKKYKAGEVIIQEGKSIQQAIRKIKKSYHLYEKGVKKFTEYFYFESYYKKRLTFLEKLV